MNVNNVMADLERKHPGESEYLQAVREVLESIDLDAVKMNGYGFQIELKYTAWKLGFRIAEHSIIFIDREAGTSKMSSGIFGEAFFGVMKLPFRRITARK